MSIIICAYNGEKTIAHCIESIKRQSHQQYECIIVDGGSTDNTLTIVKEKEKKDKRIKILHNKNRFPEGRGNGKWLGFQKARGTIVAIIDQDNVLQREDVFTQAIGKLQDKATAGVAGGLTHSLTDAPVVRFVSMVGTDAFFAYRSLDFYEGIAGKDTHATYSLSFEEPLLTGGNCFFYRKEDIQKMGEYERDIRTIQNLSRNGYNKVTVIRGATKHYAEKNVRSLIRKKFLWGRNYFNKNDRINYIPSTKKGKLRFIKNTVFCFLLVPHIGKAVQLYKRREDPVAFLFPLIAFSTALAYSLAFIHSKFKQTHR